MWKQQLIATRSESEKALKQYLRKAKVGPYHFNPNACEDTWSFSADRATEDEEEPVLHLRCEFQQGFEITNLLVAETIRGRGLGALAVKCAVGVAYEMNAPHIHVNNIALDGFSFWPTMGALPYDNPAYIVDDIKSEIELQSRDLKKSQITTLTRVLNLAAINAYDGWRALSQSEIRLKDGEFFKAAVFEKRTRDFGLIIRLDDLSTQTLLRKRLGALPQFALHRSREMKRLNQNLEAFSP